MNSLICPVLVCLSCAPLLLGCGGESSHPAAVETDPTITLFVTPAQRSVDDQPLPPVSTTTGPDLDEVKRQFDAVNWTGDNVMPFFSLLRSRDDRRYSLNVGRPIPPATDIFVMWEGGHDGRSFIVGCSHLQDVDQVWNLVSLFYADDPALQTAAPWVQMFDPPVPFAKSRGETE